MRKFSAELPVLKNVIADIKLSNDNFHNTTDFHDLKETIWIFIDDYIQNNQEIYKDKYFDDLIQTNVYESMYCCYNDIFNELELQINNNKR